MLASWEDVWLKSARLSLAAFPMMDRDAEVDLFLRPSRRQ